MRSIYISAAPFAGPFVQRVQLPGSTTLAPGRMIASIFGAKAARIHRFVDDHHCLWVSSEPHATNIPLFRDMQDGRTISGPLVVTGYDPERQSLLSVAIHMMTFDFLGIEYIGWAR